LGIAVVTILQTIVILLFFSGAVCFVGALVFYLRMVFTIDKFYLPKSGDKFLVPHFYALLNGKYLTEAGANYRIKAITLIKLAFRIGFVGFICNIIFYLYYGPN
jgi:hypothetical protein